MEITKLQNNQNLVTIKNATVFISYETPIFLVKDNTVYKDNFKYSNTTSKWTKKALEDLFYDDIIEITSEELKNMIDLTFKVI